LKTAQSHYKVIEEGDWEKVVEGYSNIREPIWFYTSQIDYRADLPP